MKSPFSFKLWFTVVLFLFSLTGCIKQKNDQNKQITVVFRFDDPSALSSLKTELSVIKSFKEHNASLTFGVIPYRCKDTRDPSPQELFPLGEDKAHIFQKAAKEGIVDLALHGYSHQMSAKKSWTEFKGLEYKEQLKKLSEGKAYLEKLMGIPIHTFIPPYNTYDLNTLKALEVLGFEILSAGIHGNVIFGSKLAFMPMSIRLHQLKQSVEKARNSLDKEPLIVVMFHEYDFLDMQVEGIDKKLITIEDLNRLLIWLNQQKDVQIENLKQATYQIDDLSAKRLSYIQYYESLKSIVPGFLKQSKSVYPEISSLFDILMKTLILYMVILVGTAFVTWKIGCRMIIRFENSKYFIIIPIGILLISFSVHLLTDMQMQARVLAIYLILVGCILGISACLIRKLK